jgi:A/G-specific adenine glycosylase
MLQQTQALRVVPIYGRFLERFPSVGALAVASSADVLRAWENLGYNRRALNLWRAARAVHDLGAFPRTVDSLEALPGVGRYTARAVASFAFGLDVGAVDANVRRVITRVAGLRPDSEVQALADELVPRGRSPEWSQAMIDLGAEVCRARSPRCGGCPLRTMCAWSNGVRPAKVRSQPASRFEDTTRYARGLVVQVLRRGDGLTERVLASRTGLDANRLGDALAGLQRDGLITKLRTRFVLGR